MPNKQKQTLFNLKVVIKVEINFKLKVEIKGKNFFKSGNKYQIMITLHHALDFHSLRIYVTVIFVEM